MSVGNSIIRYIPGNIIKFQNKLSKFESFGLVLKNTPSSTHVVTFINNLEYFITVIPSNNPNYNIEIINSSLEFKRANMYVLVEFNRKYRDRNRIISFYLKTIKSTIKL